MPKPDPETLAMAVSNSVFIQYGFGPSQSVCLPFAHRVLAEWSQVVKEVDK